jgi:hypothetical protein
MPTIDIPDKICPHCGGIRWKVTKHIKSKNGMRYECNVKRNEIGRLYYQKIRQDPEKSEKIRNRRNAWARNNKDKRSASIAKYLQTDKGKLMKKKKEKLSDDKKRQNLADVYLRKQLKHHFKLSPDSITEDVIKKYKTYLLSLRELKQLENEKESN